MIKCNKLIKNVNKSECIYGRVRCSISVLFVRFMPGVVAP